MVAVEYGMLDAEHENGHENDGGSEPPIRGKRRAKQERVSDFEQTVDWVGNSEAFENEGGVQKRSDREKCGKWKTYYLPFGRITLSTAKSRNAGARTTHVR